MAAIVYGVFLAADSAQMVATELGNNCEQHFGYNVQVHDRGHLDAQLLPDSATEVGQNTVRAIGLGALFGIVVGASLGASGIVMGLGVAMGLGLGLVAGILAGGLCGLMAGTRKIKNQLSNAAGELGMGRVMVTVEVNNPKQIDQVLQTMREASALEVGYC